MTVSLEKQTMLDAFEQKRSPSLFLSSMFKTGPRDVFRTRKGIIDAVRKLEKMAIDINRSAGSFSNVGKRFTTKEYEPPYYDESTYYQQDELFERMPGKDPFEDPDYTTQLLATITDDQVELMDVILRAIEKQASDALFAGAITLVNGDSLDFNQKATHQHDAALAWSNASAKIPADFEAVMALNRADGKSDSELAIFSNQSWTDFLASASMTSRFNFRRVDLNEIKNPAMNQDGAAFHGLISIGSYSLQCWTYPQIVDIPTDAEKGLPSGTITNAGTTIPYIPANRVYVGPSTQKTDFRLIYAGIPELITQVNPALVGLGITAVPVNSRAKFRPYAKVDVDMSAIKIGVRSAPLCIPVGIDKFSIINTSP